MERDWARCPISLLLREADGRITDLAPGAESAFLAPQFDITPDGETVVTTWLEQLAGGVQRSRIVRLDPGLRVLASDDECDFESPRISPCGQFVAVIRDRASTWDRAGAAFPRNPRYP